MEKYIQSFIEMVKFNENGLVVVVVQDLNGIILMVAYMNTEAIEKTLQTGKMHYYSRSRKKLWLKGESSGNFQFVKDIYIDCDNDALLFRVQQKCGACHSGYYSCFYRKFEDGNFKIIEEKIFEPEDVYNKEIKKC
ncbi:MAG TPA: phosphoribosyl-AMP cyclohydrolase [Candidatus Ratteibacteria bacterium]|nr:phosphoribosyl-AMP cyclohydrolase [bacterium]HRR95168.1 phosphoribosyl-AMP cyclohydrolase [Candidatus Ratteibacteria bacterium]